VNAIDWECEVKTLFRNENLGCRKAVSQAITWFFQNVDEGIILEDDCLPEKSFFSFCETMLIKFRGDQRIMHISGSNFQISAIGEGSYYLSRLPHIWGWATWKRAWEKYDVNIADYDKSKRIEIFQDLEINEYWNCIFDKIKNGEIDTWDYQWTYSIFVNNSFSILPQNNLVKNIGFDSRGTHTLSGNSIFANLKTWELEDIVHVEPLTYEEYPDINFQRSNGFYKKSDLSRISIKGKFKMMLKRFWQTL
jgi:hypothetical protein